MEFEKMGPKFTFSNKQDEFYFNVPQEFARPFYEERFGDVWRTYKGRLRRERVYFCETIEQSLALCPKKVDPNHWRDFVLNANDPKVREASLKKSKNRSNNKFGHTLGRKSFVVTKYELMQKNPGKTYTRDDMWMKGHERRDGMVLPSAEETYLKVKAAYEKKQKSNSGSEDSTSSNTNENINDDAVAEVYRMQKQGGTRGVGSHVSKKQYQVATVGQIIHEQSKPANADDIIELKNSIASLEKLVKASILQPKSREPTTVQNSTRNNTPEADVGSNSNHLPTQQNLMNLFQSVEPHLSSSRPKVILLTRDGSHVAKGFVETNLSSGTCHGKKILS